MMNIFGMNRRRNSPRAAAASYHVPSQDSRRFGATLSEAIRAANLPDSEFDCLRFIEDHLDIMQDELPELTDRLGRMADAEDCESLIAHGLPSSVGEHNLLVSKIVSGMLSRFVDGSWGPAQIQQEKGGLLWSILKPTSQLANAQSGQGRVRFEHHTDMAWLAANYKNPHRVKPRFNILAGIQNPSGTRTTYASLKRVMEAGKLTPAQISLLAQPIYRIPIPDEMGLEPTHSPPSPILWQDEKGKWCMQTRAGIIPDDLSNRGAIEALEQLRTALEECEESFCVRGGSYALVNNVLGSHSREPIRGQEERLLLRLYVASLADLRAHTHVFDARPLLDARRGPTPSMPRVA